MVELWLGWGFDNTELLNVPTPVDTAGEEATIKAPSASSNTPGNVTKRK